MAGAYGDKILSDPDATIEDGMRAALLWLAESMERKGKHFVAGEIRAAAEDQGT
jgi:2-keto-4-pentenoate hydratase